MNTETGQHSLRVHDWRAIRRFVIYMATLIAVVGLVSFYFAKVMAPLCIAAFLAYLINPMVNALERRSVNRGVAGMIILVLIFGIVVWAAVRLFPYIYEQLVDLFQQIPALIDNMSKNVGRTLREALRERGVKEGGVVDKALKGFDFIGPLIAQMQMSAQNVFIVGAGVMGSLLHLALIPVLAFYCVVEKASLIQALRRVTPRDVRPYGRRVSVVVDETLTNVIRGHIKVALTLSCLYSIGFSAIGLSAGVAIGITAGICRVIPYLDVLVGLTFGVTYIFSQQLPTITVFWLVGVIGLVQILDGVLITPRLIGSKVGLHPIVVILTVLASGAQFGFWGVLLAIPGAALIKAMYKLILPVYRDSSWFTGRS